MVAIAMGTIDMDKDKARRYREDVSDLVANQNVELPKCFVDGKPCDVQGGCCEISAFGCFASDGNDEVLWSCPRLKKK